MSLKDHKRLDRLYPALSGDERISAISEAYHADESPDPLLYRDVPPDQQERFWYQVRLLRAVHMGLGWYTAYVDALVSQVELRYGWLLTFRLWAFEAERVLCFLELHTGKPRGKAVSAERSALLADLRRRVAAAELDPPQEDSSLLERIPRGLFDKVAAELAERWKEVRLAELAAVKLERQLGGNDPLQPAIVPSFSSPARVFSPFTTAWPNGASSWNYLSRAKKTLTRSSRRSKRRSRSDHRSERRRSPSPSRSGRPHSVRIDSEDHVLIEARDPDRAKRDDGSSDPRDPECQCRA
jgi:hypothetical protein